MGALRGIYNLLGQSVLDTIIKWFFNTKVTRDVLKDSGNDKYSLTKITTTLFVVMLLFMDFISIQIMLEEKEVDHFLIIENFTFVATLLGFKNYRKEFSIKDKEPKKALLNESEKESN